MTAAILFLIAATLFCTMVYEGPNIGNPMRVLLTIFVLVPFAIFVFAQVGVMNFLLRNIHFRLVPESKD